MKTESLSPASELPVQESPMGMRKKIAIGLAILAILAVCGLALWQGFQMVLRATSGQS
jgi:hypothetical protein